jgi:putative PIN family toxin of toxin-antitoxin system
MRIVLDINVVISALMWGGTPRIALDKARRNEVTLYSSLDLIDELSSVLHRQKFQAILSAKRITPLSIVNGYAALAHVIAATPSAAHVPRDPDDDAVIHCALVCEANLIISGDRHLLSLHPFRSIDIFTPEQANARYFNSK